ncbi:EamA family transporter [Schleiferia thermophila]|uniref:EamA family transporter n=1 Tax=Schleiferia thermophila TaxID=884107 RepID=UPI003EEB6AAE
MIWFLLSVFCSVSIFLIFRFFPKYEVNTFRAIVINYIVAFTLGMWIYLGKGQRIPGDLGYWPFVVLIGFLFITLFGLMASVTQMYGITVVSITVKMSLAIPVLFSLLYFGEKLTVWNFAGIVLAFPALVLSTYQKSSDTGRFRLGWMPVVLFLGSGLLDSLLKLVQQTYLTEATSSLFSALCFGSAFVFGLVYLMHQKVSHGMPLMDVRSLVGGIVLGIPNYGSIYFLVKALQIPGMDGARAFPINNMGIVIVSALVSVLFFGERFTLARSTAVGLAVAAILLMSLS